MVARTNCDNAEHGQQAFLEKFLFGKRVCPYAYKEVLKTKQLNSYTCQAV